MLLERATVAIPFESMAQLTGRAPRETVFLSRYPGEPVMLPPAPDPDVVSIHPHRLQLGNWLVFEWTFDAELDDWQQQGPPFVVPSMREAIEYVPPGFDEVAAGDFATLVFKAAR
jgi:hypothetical protein